MADVEAPAKKSPFAKIIAIAIGILAAGTGADAAGVQLDPGVIKTWGVGSSVLLIAYLELRFMPTFVPLLKRLIARDSVEVNAANDAAPVPAPDIPTLPIVRAPVLVRRPVDE